MTNVARPLGVVMFAVIPFTCCSAYVHCNSTVQVFFEIACGIQECQRLPARFVFKLVPSAVLQFYKESNAFLEAERSVYVQSLRDLEEKLRVSSLELSQQQQVAAEAGKLAEELQEDKLRLM